MPQKFPPKSSTRGSQSDVEKYDDVLNSLTSIQTKHKNSNINSDSSIKPSTIIMVIVIVGSLSVLLLSLGNLQVNPNSQTGPIDTGTSLSADLDFKIQLLDGTEVMLSDYVGEPIILDLFATWCGPCVDQIGHLQTVRNLYPNVRILSVSVDLTDTLTMLTDFKADHNMGWVVGRDITRQGGSIYQANSIPTMAFFDADAKIQHWEQGVTNSTTLISWINVN
ncbi:MAG: TlpA family protein disulfide reductase [Candidatus Hodarchaeales archaeon]|jgi:thiol-disulfide isomerase/thioredoxin